jgi:hypothetical protein
MQRRRATNIDFKFGHSRMRDELASRHQGKAFDVFVLCPLIVAVAAVVLSAVAV